MKVDITFESWINPEVFYGIQSSTLIQQLCYEEQNLKGIVIVLKNILHMCHLDKPYFGGINSYMMVMLVAAFLRSNRSYNICDCFMKMLKYYGKDFDTKRSAIIGGYIVPVINVSGVLIISDQFRPGINIAQSASRFSEIQIYFSKIYDKLIELKRNWDFSKGETIKILHQLNIK